MNTKTMRDDILIKFMQEVSNQLGTFSAELKEINRRLDDGSLRMEDSDKYHEIVQKEIAMLKESDKQHSETIRSMKSELQPVVEFGKTLNNNRKFVIYVATFVSAMGIIIGAIVVGIEKVRGN